MTKPYIIVVDDNPGILDMISTAAEEWGYEVSATESVEKFLALFAVRQPDAIILDIVMPETHGIELLEILQRSQSQTAIIMITGYGQNYLDAAAKLVTDRGMNLAGAFKKPITLKDLRKALQDAVPGTIAAA